MTVGANEYEVGGVRLKRPFRIRRLGHFQFMSENMRDSLHFYQRLLGFRLSDTLELSGRLPAEWRTPLKLAELGDTKIYFNRHGSDHHSFVLGSARVRRLLRNDKAKVTVSQIAWQVGSLREVAQGHSWFDSKGIELFRSGRDKPGSNWHSYIWDPDGHTNEIFYGIDQIGWQGASKPFQLYKNIAALPDLPHVSDYHEVHEAAAAGIELGGGYRTEILDAASYDVGGVLLAQPFKVVGIGPIRMLVRDMAKALVFYRDILGLRVTEEVLWKGHRCVFLRANTEHHSMALYPESIRADLGLDARTMNLSFAVRVGDYRQLRDAIAFLIDRGVQIRQLPAELSPGIAYSAFAIDPDGHLVQLYHQMDQIGWDGQPRRTAIRPPAEHAAWPDTLDDTPDQFCGEQYLGPVG
jgi:catechol 2,3-dioxygenase-like lactoylglutathione lyase family enzyme